jgi:hypothetical protein
MEIRCAAALDGASSHLDGAGWQLTALLQERPSARDVGIGAGAAMSTVSAH